MKPKKCGRLAWKGVIRNGKLDATATMLRQGQTPGGKLGRRREKAMSGFPSTQVTCLLPVKDLERARRFYEGAMGLEAVGAKPDGKFVYRCGGTEIALFPKAEGTKAQHTALSFRVADVASAIATLKSRGVVFADYDFPGLKTVNHVCVLGSEKAAWFEDPEGNILCLHEDLV